MSKWNTLQDKIIKMKNIFTQKQKENGWICGIAGIKYTLSTIKNWYAQIYVQMYYIFKMKLVQNVYGQNENIFLKYNYFER